MVIERSHKKSPFLEMALYPRPRNRRRQVEVANLLKHKRLCWKFKSKEFDFRFDRSSRYLTVPLVEFEKGGAVIEIRDTQGPC